MNRRRYCDDDDRGGPRKRRKVQSEATEIEDRLESLITRVGEKSTSSLESNLEGLASVLEADLQTYKMRIMRILSWCAVSMPEKCSIYTTLIGLLNVKNYNFGGEFVELMVRNLKESLKSWHWEAARYTLRFISDMVNCHVVSIPSLIGLLNNMAEVTTEEGPQVRKDWYTFAILTTLPWIGRELYEQKDRELEQLLTKLERHIHTRNKIHHPALQVWRVDTPHVQEEYLDCLWAQIRKLKADGWQEKHILRPYLGFDQVLCEALQHTLPSIYPPPHHPGCSYPMPHVVFRLFDYTDCPDGPVLPGAHAIERFLIEEQLRHIIKLHVTERKHCAAHLLAFPQKHLVPLEYMIVEVIMSEFFALPNMRYLEIALGSLLIELCKLQPATMPQVLAQATEMLWERLDYMNVSCFERFCSWFSYHLSQFQFRWSWDDWSDCLALPQLHPKKKFIQEVLEKCLRLSYHQRIVDMMPDPFKGLAPEKPEPFYKFSGENAETLPDYPLAITIQDKIRSKCTADEIIIVLRQPVDGEEQMLSPEEKAYVFIHVLLHLGSKTFSHSFSAIAKFHAVLKLLGDTEDTQIALLTGLYDLWKYHAQKIVVLVDKLLKSQIVECAAVLNWLFSKEMAHEFTKHYVWEIVHLTIRKMNKHVMKLEKELADARENLKEGGQSSDSEAEGDRPSEETIEKMEEKVEAAQANQKNLFLIIFQRFIMLLSEHIVRADTDGRDFRTHWWTWVLGRLQEVFMLHHEQVYRYKDTLETLLFTQDLDVHILSVFHQFTSLRA